jgi:hypothetical protein
MKHRFAIVAAVAAALAFTAPSANAGGRHHLHISKLTAVSIGVGAASTASYFAINNWHWAWQGNSSISQWGAIGATTMGCLIVAPMVGTVVMDRPLTIREVHTLAGSCVLPILGGILVNAAYDAHPEWPGGGPRWHKHHRHHKMKKM